MLSQVNRTEESPSDEFPSDASERILIGEDYCARVRDPKENETISSSKHEGIRKWIQEINSETSDLLKLVIPAIGTNVFLVLLSTVDQIMVGQLGKDEIAAAALGNAWFNLVWYFVVGVATLLDTLGSQAHGLGRKDLVAYHTRRAMVAVLVLCIPLCVLVSLAEPILRDILGQDPKLSKETGRFCLPLLPGVPFLAIAIILQKHLQTQGIMSPALYARFIANIFNGIVNYILIYSMDWGLTGAPWATSLTRACQAIALGYASHRYDPGLFSELLMDIQACNPLNLSVNFQRFFKEKNIKPVEMESFERKNPKNLEPVSCESKTLEKVNSNFDDMIEESGCDLRLTWGSIASFLRQGAAGGAMVALEAWCFKIMIILAGLLDDTVALDAHVVVSTLTAFTFITFPFGVSIAASVRVGHLLGAGAPQRARIAANAALVLGTGSMALTGIAIYLGRYTLPRAFTDDQDVADAAAEIAPIAALYQILDGFQGVAAGVYRGIGRQRTVAILNLIGFWIVGTPVGALLTFVAEIGVVGLWWGLCSGLGVLSIIFAIALAQTDWEKAAANAIILINSDSTPSRGQDRHLELQ
eukprot:TRINITY_DN8268_c0_g2_i1.p1 TRINITY_DN8268_c0_g2~~TRINITY_DN8268_c0_g2_i1.p1  ORF type:complete len:586 (+),score=90.00 TRINITY_DN8268_c0_g2_i1:549-2306(+)